MIVRGTTPTHTFKLPIDSVLCKRIRVVYQQGGKDRIKVDEDRLNVQGDQVSLKLTREETLSLNADTNCDIQIRILTAGGDALASDIIKRGVGPVLDDEVLV